MFQITNRELWRITPATGLSLAVIVFTGCFAWFLPPNYGQENGPVENLQVVVLCLAALVAFSARSMRLTPKRRKLYALAGVILLLSVARELSWGRVFYMDSAGNIPPLKTLWFGPAVNPLLGVVIIVSLIYFFAMDLHQELFHWLQYDKFPLLDLVLVIGGMISADVVEHYSLGLFGIRTELFEELLELSSYCAVLSFMFNTIFDKKFHAD